MNVGSPGSHNFLLTDSQLRSYVSIPQFIFVGMQTSGKSSLVESLVGLQFNFTGTGIATRVPLQISTSSIHPAPLEPKWDLRWDVERPLHSRHFRSISTSEVRKQIHDIHIELITHQMVCPIPISLSLHWSGARNLRFIDLPGFKGNARDQDEKEIQSKIYEMNKNIILQNQDEVFVVVEPASSDASNYIAHQIFKDIVGNPELGKSVILACSKFDLVKDVDELHKYLSEYASYVCHSFVFSCPHSSSKNKEGAFDSLLSLCNDSDLTRATQINKGWDNTEFGINKFSNFLETLLEQRILAALPLISKNLEKKLSEKETEMERFWNMNSESTHTWVKKHLNSTVVEFVGLMIQAWDAKRLESLPMRTRTEEENIFHHNETGNFNYQNSVLWKNPEYQPKTRELVLFDYALAGSAQIRRLLREFEVSLFTRVLNIDDNFKTLLQNKIFSMRGPDGSCTAWNEVIVELVRDMARTFLETDIDFLRDNVQFVLETWGEALLSSNLTNFSDIPMPIRENILEALSKSLRGFLSCSAEQMKHFVESAIVTARYRSVPKPGSTISELFDFCSSLYSKDSSSAVNQELGEIGITITNMQVGKAKRLCMTRLNLGVTVISQTLGAMFDSFFTSQFRHSLPKEMVKWEHDFTANYSEDFYQKEMDILASEIQKISSWLKKISIL